ncbi:MAG: Transcriptional activator adenine-specific methyltransferase-like protein [Herminiimonas sp.]|nr:Transcriptional activator adenine-specific methyltransferase-like protein [Herminiimonas sp.]
MDYQLHPLCSLFPPMSGWEFDSLKSDIAANGLRQPITVHRCLILDGGNRYRACLELGIKPTFAEFAHAEREMLAFVLSSNLHRRHLTTGQHAAIVASAQNWGHAQTVGKPSKSGSTTGLETVANRAAASGASDKTQRMADKVARDAPDLAWKVAHGEISLAKAHQQIATPLAPALRSRTAPTNAAPTATLREAAPTQKIEELQDELDETREVIDALKRRNDELEAENKTLLLAADSKVLDRLQELQGYIKAVESQRNDWQNQCSEMKKQVKRLQRDLDKAKVNV